MFEDRSVWQLACDMASSGEFANIIMIERELRRRGLISHEITSNTYKREFLTRACHAARDGERIVFASSPLQALRAGT